MSIEMSHLSGKSQYNETSVINAALDAFWRHGYAATSINVLTAATGLSRSSLYQRFQDKDGLFQAALATYTDRVMRRMASVETATPRARLESLLYGLLTADTERPPGCLLARSCAEMVDLTPAGQLAARSGMDQQCKVLVEWFEEAIRTGELAADSDARSLSWYFLGVMQAILNLPQAGANRDDVEKMVTLAMSVWPKT